MSETHASSHHWMNRIVEAFLGGNLSVLLILISLIAGVAALAITPREEDPQIVVPIADVLISMPGASAREVERQVATRLEKLLYQIDGVEYVYSTSFPSQAIVTVRFYVGEDRERSWVKLHNKIQGNIDQVPPGVAGWVVKPVEIDDVPITNLTLYSDRYDDYALRRMAEELEIRLQGVKNAGRTYVVGGRPREITVHLSSQLMAGRGVSLQDIQRVLQAANATLPAGNLVRDDEEIRLDAGRFLTSAEDVGNLIVGVREMRPVLLREVAAIQDGPAEARTYTRIALGEKAYSDIDPAAKGEDAFPEHIERYRDYPAVTVAVAKRKGTNAVWVSEEVRKEAERFAGEVLPPDVHMRVTRDYGETADHKVNELVEALLVAIAIVVLLLAYTLGWREGIIIALAVPVTFSFTLLINLFLGFTINRVTLFALILSLGLVVDDPIVDVENIHRHFAMRKVPPYRAVVEAVNEVRPPIILATLAVIISFLPMFFITGMMGPYMAPMALNVPVAMLMSLLVAFTITPWLSLHMLRSSYDKPHGEPETVEESALFRAYKKIMDPMIQYRGLRWGLLGFVLILLAFAVWLVFSHRVPLKMLPFDNKNELQVVVDMPEGTTLETTEAATYAMADYLVRLPEVTDVTTWVGTASPMDFNGLVRHYYLREGANVADIRFNLIGKKQRKQQSHAIGLRIRNDLKEIARRYDANIKIVESPPGPPVIATLVAEVYGHIGQPYEELAAAAKRVGAIMETTHGVVDVDDVLVAPEKKRVFRVDRKKAAFHGISDAQIAETLQGMVMGSRKDSLRVDTEVNPVHITLRLPREARTSHADLDRIMIRGQSGEGVFLSELGTFEDAVIDQPIYHKNLTPVVYVFGETAGLPPPDAVLTLEDKVAKDGNLEGFRVIWSGEGEWDITLRVFRDLGIAFGVAVLGIYILLLYQTQSYLLPAIQLIALPLSVIGILPGFWMLNLITGDTVGGWGNPVYFTATAMIGMIALAGIATRNSILLIEFVEARKSEGKPLVRSLIEAGALRTRPILLTSLAAMLAAWPITLDPIFSGLAWALIFGIAVSTFFTLIVVPVVYYMAYGKDAAEEAGER
ncbi:efflux RND transporter permease subunit [Desulforhabdus amnigena]|jgi:multidrug efflux pump subunit AcrB|uniref:Acriflavine resistance protein B n=1 Tax=Desulforhabdus amnigena TaxID=40218 RepID=A0A9W6FWY5_9BACT|nr:efflux RND transporter permease subunit [Desulforhabdus amnigena]NLJ28479.1 efflux RND transporter permease subunit [Deltaproteobacteria bacterium]GLI36499.1 acriflavine resistance protein B [Desulforhabdus amnigena]